MSQLMEYAETASQTAGPYVHIGCTPNVVGIAIYGGDLGATMKTGPVRGEQIAVVGTIYDGKGAVVTDALVEIWQADADGLFPSPHERRGTADPNFTGFGRTVCDPETGEFRFDTLKPGRVPWSDGRPQAPHISVWIAARGINIGLHTRIYFSDEADANAEDPVLARVREPGRIATLTARKIDANLHRFDIHLQGPKETVFFDI